MYRTALLVVGAVSTLLSANLLAYLAWLGANAVVRERAARCDFSLTPDSWVYLTFAVSMLFAVAGVITASWAIVKKTGILRLILIVLLAISLAFGSFSVYSFLRDAPPKAGTNCSG